MEEHAPSTATDLMDIPDQPYAPLLVIADEAAELAGLGDKNRKEQTKSNLGSLVRRGRFIGALVCVATQRPDVSFIPGEVRANLGTRVLCGEGDVQMYSMALEVAPEDVVPLTPPHRRGQGRVCIGGAPPRELQLAFVSAEDVLAAHQVQEAVGDVVPEAWTEQLDADPDPSDRREEPHDDGD